MSILLSTILLVQGAAFAVEDTPAGPVNLSTITSFFSATNNGTMAVSGFPLPWRGILIGGDHGSEGIHHDDCYVQIDNGPVLYYTTIPARRQGNALPDQGLLWHLFTREGSTYTVYATSSYVDGLSSDLSEGLAIDAIYDSSGCTEQTVPVPDAGQDQVVPANTEVTLDGTESFDPYGPDTASLIYRWECYAAPETVTLSEDGQGAIATFTPTTTGLYYFRFSLRDEFEGSAFNRSPVSYVRISAVEDPADPDLLDVNAGRTKQAQTGQEEAVHLVGSGSKGPAGTTYQWEQTNPVGIRELENMAEVFGTTGCQGQCYKANFDADPDVDGGDMAVLANNWGPVVITNSDEPEATFIAGIARPHIFRLTVDDGFTSSSETTIVAVNHPNVSEVVTPPPVDPACLN
ncbi:MAG: hypothetical protein SWQ30_16565 [Thermodesulfobacteriota bacterium]|nr:hypothetical protein [Thermodesulfobacteriota bacterium]